jgi:AcrR family transcriptional regulator
MARVSRAEAKAATKAKLLRAAAKVFEQKGFGAATVEEIADRAGFTRGAFYANFSDKADVLMTVLEQRRDHDMQNVAELVASTPDDQKLSAVQGWYDELVGDERLSLALAELWPIATRDPNLRARLAARQHRQVAAISAMIDSYATSENITLPIPVEVLASYMLALAEGISQQRVLDPASVDDDAFTTAMMHLWFGVTGGS